MASGSASVWSRDLDSLKVGSVCVGWGGGHCFWTYLWGRPLTAKRLSVKASYLMFHFLIVWILYLWKDYFHLVHINLFFFFLQINFICATCLWTNSYVFTVMFFCHVVSGVVWLNWGMGYFRLFSACYSHFAFHFLFNIFLLSNTQEQQTAFSWNALNSNAFLSVSVVWYI